MAQQPAPAPAPAPPAQAPPTSPAQATPQQAAPTPRGLRTVVLDPGHGGTDAGARGPSGVIEKDEVMVLARAVRSELERQGYRVVMTRTGDENPSFDDRAALANGQPAAVFLTLHISSNGPPGTARAYYFDFPKAQAAAAGSTAGGVLLWNEAQRPGIELSRRLAELLQVLLAQTFRGSPDFPSPAAVHQLRSVAEPAIAVEISSVAVPDAGAIEQMATGLATAVARAVNVFRPLYESGAK